MKCLICGRLSLPGAKLCLDCKAARKRAFDATVTQPLLAAAGASGATRAAPRLLKSRQPVPHAARRAAKKALAAQAQSNLASEIVPPPPPQRAPRWPMILGSVILIAAVLGYFGHWFSGAKSDTAAAVPEHLDAQSPAASSPKVSATMPMQAAPAASASVSREAEVVEPAVPPKVDASKKPNPRARVEKAPVALPPPEPAPAPEVVVVAPPPPPVVREPPRVDPFQAMYDAIARCSRDTSDRAACERRARTQYCEGHWGQVAQCASIPYVDHGS
jgi:hypothetical protein